jgi:hypothetical protein
LFEVKYIACRTQSYHITRHSTTSTEATEIIKGFLFEFQYMARWEGVTRRNADKNPLRPVLLRINSGCSSRLNDLDKKKVHKSFNVLVQIYYRLLGSDEGVSAVAEVNEQ